MGSLYIGNNLVAPIVTDVKRVVESYFLIKLIQGDVTDITADELEGVTKIADYFFRYSNITSLSLPSALTSIGLYAFASTKRLVNIDFSRATKLHTLGEGTFELSAIKSIDLSKTIINDIPNSCFSSCHSLESIVFPDTLKSIDSLAFMITDKLTSISLPHGFIGFGYNAIDSTSSITSITYDGTIAEWNTIVSNSDSRWCHKDITVHCTDGDVSVTAS